MTVKDLFRLATVSLVLSASVATASAQAYTYVDQETSLAAAQADVANWMKYLPDNVFAAHLSIPGTHDTMTGHKWISNGLIGSSTAESTSTTQSAKFSEQLEAGIRGLDFRPGLKSGTVYCGHGGALTEVTFDAALKTLTDFIDAHPSEFFFIHLFRGNVYPTDASASIGCTNKQADINTYRNIIEGMLNGDGKYAKYIIDYDPMLTVGEMRGKIVIFRRDRISILELEKAGNVENWTMQFNPENPSPVRNASNPRIKGILHAQDISSPYENKEDEDLEAEKKYCKALLAYAREQQAPNEVANPAEYYPFWVMNFTSGEAGSSGKAGYQTNAKTMNPLAIADIKEAAANGVYGPTGIVLSDWVLNDTYSGKELITTILENNFHYIDRFRVDNLEAFAKDYTSGADLPDYFHGGTYFLQNVGTGLYLEEGNWWGTCSRVSITGMPVTITKNEKAGGYQIKTLAKQSATQNYLGSNLYMDSDEALWTIEPVSGGNYVIMLDNQGFGIDWLVSEDNYTMKLDGSFDRRDANFQWKAIPYDERIAELNEASVFNPLIATYMSRKLCLWANDPEIEWTVKLGSGFSGWSYKSASKAFYANKDESDLKRGMLYLATPSGVNSGNNAATWSANTTVTGLPNGKYTLEFDGATSVKKSVTLKLNGNAVALKNGIDGSLSAENAYKAINGVADYRNSFEVQVTDNTLKIELQKTSDDVSQSATALTNFKLTYYGPQGYTQYGYYKVYHGIELNDSHDTNHIALTGHKQYAANTIELSDEDAHVMPFDVAAAELTYNRPVKEELRGTDAWHAIYLPFEVEDWAAISATRVIEFTGVKEGDGADVLVFTDVENNSKLEAHHLYLVQLDGDIDVDLFDAMLIGSSDVEPITFATSTNAYTLCGNFEVKTDMFDTDALALSGNAFVKAANESVVLKPFRAYLTVTSLVMNIEKAPQRVALAIDRGGITTGIDNIEDDMFVDDAPLYNLNGQRVSNPTPGLYLRNGAKVIIK